MAKYEIEMELTGFKLKVRGEREDIPVITENLQRQMSGLIGPAINIAQGRLPESPRLATSETADDVAKKPKRNARTRRAPGQNGDAAVQIVNWHHDPGKWGVPRQSWKALQKIVWLMYVALQEAKVTELSASSIVDTFNCHFKQSGLLKKSSMTSLMAGLKQHAPALVNDHANKSPITWFLTDEGIKRAQKLVAEAKGEAVVESQVG